MDFSAASPEALGIPSRALLAFLSELDAQRLPMHTVLLLRGRALAMEACWKPFDRDFEHRLYSSSKTFVSAAIGILAGEGRLALSDRVADYFPEYVTPETHPWVLETTIEDCLTMRTPFEGCNYSLSDKEWVRSFFTCPNVSHPPGTVFRYNTGATVVLNGLAEKLTGLKLFDFLRERVLDELGFSAGAHMLERPEGGHWGGSAVIATARDFAAFVRLLLDGGRCGDKQLIPEWYVRRATSAVTDNRMDSSEPDMSYGYGYQIWRTRDGFMLYGMGAQLGIGIPGTDVVLVTTGDTQAVSGGVNLVINAFYNLVAPYIAPGALPEDPEGAGLLSAKLASLSLALPAGEPDDPAAAELYGRTFVFGENRMKLRSLRVDADGDGGVLSYVNDAGEKRLPFGIGRQALGEFPELRPGYWGERIGVLSGRKYKCAAAAAWSHGALIIQCFVIDEYFGTLKLQLTPKNGRLTVLGAKAAEGFMDEFRGFAVGAPEA